MTLTGWSKPKRWLNAGQAHSYFTTERVINKYRFCFLPRKCDASGKSLWMKFGYKIHLITDEFFDDEFVGYNKNRKYWLSKEQFVLQRLRDEL